ncbi:MAG TPA: xanthine dehydrogenase family protein molybdopterin-binding subunit, partial [Anaerolineales bacterium]|nr:xanthine dehydrogenase family protein molybdopterin-binding subunit [Anaerolineales bacterium]
MSSIGRSVRRSDALGKVTGATLFPGDIERPGMAAMKILFAGRPHAIIRSIDTAAARSLPGVVAVLTAADVPVNEYGLIYPDQPVLCGPGSSKPFADRVRFVGDQVALVVAETEAIAAEAVHRIRVEYEDLPIVTDPEAAMKPGSTLLFPDRDSNVFCHYRIRKGDVDQGFAGADVVVEAEYHTPWQEHAFLQPEAGLAYVEDGIITVEVAGQWTHEDQAQIAHALGLPKDRIRVIYSAIGGAFGGREDMSVQIVLALAAWRLHQQGIDRAVKIIWSRDESILGHHKRHPFILKAKWGATREGKVVAAEVDVIQDGGAYAYTSTKVLGNATLMCTGPYEIPHVKVDAYSVYTNNIPGGAFRGFGGPQGAFAAESQMNKLAEALRMDPVEIRMRNVLTEGALLSVGTPLPQGVSIGRVIETCAQAAGWQRTAKGWTRPAQSSLGSAVAPASSRGLGFACAFKNVGFSFGAPENAAAKVVLQGTGEIERVVVHHAGADVGQGAHTVMAQMAAEAVGVPIDKVELVVSDTATTGDSGSASASRMTFMAGNSIRGAAERALERWRMEDRPAVGTFEYRPPETTPLDPQTGKSEPNFSYGYVAEAVIAEVDRETGHIRLVKVTCADDVGRAVNPQQVQGQIEGAVVQAAGYAVLENFVHQGGLVQTPHLSTYLIPTVLDIPDQVESLILEYADP